MKTTYRGLLFACVAFLLSACFIGNKYDYDNTRGAVSYTGQDKRVAVATFDQRPYVLNGDKDPDFVGLQRNHWGIPFDVGTASEQPLATEMTNSLARTLDNAGFAATPVQVSFSDGLSAVQTSLLASHPARTVLLRVDQWESDTLKNPAVFYDLTLRVTDGSGHILATKSVKGTDDLEGQFFNPTDKAKRIVPDTFRKKAEELLNAPEIAAALK